MLPSDIEANFVAVDAETQVQKANYSITRKAHELVLRLRDAMMNILRSVQLILPRREKAD